MSRGDELREARMKALSRIRDGAMAKAETMWLGIYVELMESANAGHSSHVVDVDLGDAVENDAVANALKQIADRHDIPSDIDTFPSSSKRLTFRLD